MEMFCHYSLILPTIQYAFPWGKEEVDCLTVRSDLCNQMTIQQHGKLPFDKESTPHVIQITSDLNAGNISAKINTPNKKWFMR